MLTSPDLRLILRKAELVALLGFGNVLRVFFYRLQLRFGVHSVQRLKLKQASGDMFPDRGGLDLGLSTGDRVAFRTPLGTRSEHQYFGWFAHESTEPPPWHTDVFTGWTVPNPDDPWWKVSVPELPTGDIKAVWEMSRFSWIIPMAQNYRSGKREALTQINEWFSDWTANNKPNCGPNWMCGQEASIRLLHVIAASLILKQFGKPSRALVSFVESHLRRISATRAYAKAQRNNHVVTEAVALYTGGVFLASQEIQIGLRFQNQGYKLLNSELPKLVLEDGAFAQYSTNYHRMVVDLLVFVESFREKFGQRTFTGKFYDAALRMVVWLENLYVPEASSVPNLGGNDGSHVLKVVPAEYRDFSTTVSLARAFFLGESVDSSSIEAEYRFWLGIQKNFVKTGLPKRPLLTTANRTVKSLVRGNARVFLRQPVYKPFRPNSVDALHLDFWIDGLNVFRDAGSFSYAQPIEELKRFHGARSHNTVVFDNVDAMPQLGRFLYGSWITPEKVIEESAESAREMVGAYRDSRGNFHLRKVVIGVNYLEVFDRLEGSFREACLTWRLPSLNWSQSPGEVTSGRIKITVSSDGEPCRLSLQTEPESLYYLHQALIPVVRVRVAEPTVLATIVRWQD